MGLWKKIQISKKNENLFLKRARDEEHNTLDNSNADMTLSFHESQSHAR